MANNRAIFKSGYHKLLECLQRRWLEHGKEESLEQLVTRGMQAYRFNNEISHQQLSEIEMQLKIDLSGYAQSVSALKNNLNEPFKLVIEDTLWSWLVAITDKSQLEWIELSQDFNFDGQYRSGDIVGLGQFVCQQCNQQLSIYHPQEIGHCVDCDGELFSRAPFNP